MDLFHEMLVEGLEGRLGHLPPTPRVEHNTEEHNAIAEGSETKKRDVSWISKGQ